MKNILLGIVFLTSIFTSQAITKKVFFIGNSYIYTNDIPTLIKNAATSTGDVLTSTQETPGGTTLKTHAANANVYTKMHSNTWDYVVIQAQSQEGAYPESRFATDVMPYANQLADSAKSMGATPMFYMTWGRKNGDSYFCPYTGYEYYCTYQGMDSVLNLNYRLLGEVNNSWVSPVGQVWHNLRDNHPEIDLYSSDLSHPSLSGAYASALTFYTLIFGKDPTLVTYNSTLSATDANNIKAAVKQIVFDNMAEWTTYQDAITSISAPSQVEPNKTATVQVNYSASQQLDLVVVFQEQNAPNGTYGEKRVTVNKGTATLDVIVDIANNTPVKDKGYKLLAYLVPVGQSYAQMIKESASLNISCVNIAIPATDSIISVTGSATVKQAEVVKVDISYDATTKRDIIVYFQENGVDMNSDGDKYTSFGSGKATVEAGSGIASINITVNASTPVALTSYRYSSFITTFGGGWSQRVGGDGKAMTGVSVQEKSITVDDVISMVAPSYVGQGEKVSVTVNYEATTDREIITVFQQNSGSYLWFGTTTRPVSAGKGSITFDITIDTTAVIANNAYRWSSFMVPVGGNWSGRLDELIVNPASVGAVSVDKDFLSSQNDISLFPTPVETSLTLNLKSDKQEGYAKIYAFDGSEVLSLFLNLNNQIDVSKLANGMYFIKSIENKFAPIKFIKK